MSDPWFKFYPSDWLAGTRGLTMQECGLYVTLIAMMYEREGPIDLPDDRLARLCGTTPAAFKKALAGLIEAGKIIKTGEGYFNNRVQVEIKNRSSRKENAQRSAAVRWEKGEEKQGKADANASKAHCEADATRSQKPDTRKNIKNNILSLETAREPKPPPDDGPTLDQLWAEYPHPRSRGAKPAEKFAKLAADEKRRFREAIPALKANLAADRKRGFDRQAPMFQTYLNQRRWETELEAPTPQATDRSGEWSPFKCGP